MTLYDGDEEHMAPIYNAPVLGYAAEPGAGSGCLLAGAILSIVIGLGTTCPPEYQWIVNGFLAYGVCSLVAYVPAWWRAIGH